LFLPQSGRGLVGKIAMAISGSLARRGRQTPRKLRLPSPYQGAESSSLRQIPCRKAARDLAEG